MARAQAIGPSRGGQTTKIHALTDVLGRPGALLLTPGNASDITTAPAVLAEAPGRIRRLAADKGYDADWLRADLREKGITPIIPGKRGRKRKIRHDRRRYAEYANAFMLDVAERLKGRVQLTSDGHKPYLEAVEGAFGADVDYAVLQKVYGTAPEAAKGRYSPPVCTGAHKHRVEGQPDEKHVSTSYVERQNLTMRMHMRRFTRLTNAFSKKVEHHAYAVALHFMYYNFVRLHGKLRVSPAMAAGVTDRLWEIGDIVALVEAADAKPSKRGPYMDRATSA